MEMSGQRHALPHEEAQIPTTLENWWASGPIRKLSRRERSLDSARNWNLIPWLNIKLLLFIQYYGNLRTENFYSAVHIRNTNFIIFTTYPQCWQPELRQPEEMETTSCCKVYCLYSHTDCHTSLQWLIPLFCTRESERLSNLMSIYQIHFHLDCQLICTILG
jgi:hypothetical protein